MTDPESRLVFNVVWTGSVFPYLKHLVASQIDNSGARFRFVANGCPPDQVELMREFVAGEDRVIEVFVSSWSMDKHGDALDAVLAARDDGDHFCFVDPDILAEGPFLPDFLDALDGGCAGVTSGKGIWNEDPTVPPGHGGVPGECFYSQDGFLFGSPHFAMYRSGPLRDTMARWDIGFGTPSARSPELKAALAAAGHTYWIYDTGKLVNIFLQEDGHRLCHVEHPALLHVGGMSHYLSPPEAGGELLASDEDPDQRWPWPTSRLEVARYTAGVLRSLCDGDPQPPVPADIAPELGQRLERVRAALVAIVPTAGVPGDRT